MQNLNILESFQFLHGGDRPQVYLGIPKRVYLEPYRYGGYASNKIDVSRGNRSTKKIRLRYLHIPIKPKMHFATGCIYLYPYPPLRGVGYGVYPERRV